MKIVIGIEFLLYNKGLKNDQLIEKKIVLASKEILIDLKQQINV